MKPIFILGGSRLQLDLIYEARRLGFEIHLFDANDKCIAKNYVEHFYNIDIKDKEAILQLAIKIKPLIITTIASEIGNKTACFVGEKISANTNSYHVALNTTNKKLMKQILKSNNVKTADYKIITKLKDLNNWDKIPAIMKPTDSSAGRGVSWIGSNDDLINAYENAMEYSFNKELIIEEYIYGNQYSVETISTNGNHRIVAFTEEYITVLPKIIETGQMIPARLTNIQSKKIEKVVYNLLNAFDIKFGACHIELRENKLGEIFVVELASRMGGWRSELISLAYGISYCQLLLFSHMGKELDFRPSRDDFAIVQMILNEEDKIHYDNILRTYPNNVFCELAQINTLKQSKNLADSNGYYFLHSNDKNLISSFLQRNQI